MDFFGHPRRELSSALRALAECGAAQALFE
jgi:hypothetical protein